MSSPTPAPSIRVPVAAQRVPMDLAFLSQFSYSSVVATFEPLRPAHLPFFYGTCLRGAIGYRIPIAHPLFGALYEQEGKAPSRPFILSPQLPAEWEAILSGDPVLPPFTASTRPPDSSQLPIIRTPLIPLQPGRPLQVRFTLLGCFARLLGDLLAFLAKGPLKIGEGLLQLAQVNDGFEGGPMVWSASQGFHAHPHLHSFASLLQIPGAAAARLLLLAPLAVNFTAGGRDIENFSAAHISPDSLLELLLVRAIRLFDAAQSPAGTRLPWMEIPKNQVKITASRLFQNSFERVSAYQKRSMVFSGVVGHIDLEGNLSPFLPLLAAAQILHAGQKAAMGLGQIRCLIAR